MPRRMLSLVSVFAVLVAPAAALAATQGGSPAPAQRQARSDPWSPDKAVTARLGSDDAKLTALGVSQTRFADDSAAHVVLTRDDKFPDALAGTPLVGDGPMLLSNKDTLDESALAELERVLPSGGKVYLLGGTAAMSQGIQDHLDRLGYAVTRLSGPSRYDTAIAVANEVRSLYPESANQALLARGYGTETNPTAGFADSVTGGAYAARAKVPVVLSDSNVLTPQTAEYLQDVEALTLLGGGAALSDAVEADASAVVADVRRVAGAGRDATAASIATELWDHSPGSGRYTIINGYEENAWQFGLPAAGLAADFDAPMLVAATDVVPGATLEAVSANDVKSVATLALGGTATLSNAVLDEIEARDACDGCTTNPPVPLIGDGTLMIGRLLPWSHPAVEHLAAAAESATNLGLQDLADAGGIPGLDVVFVEGDTAGDATVAAGEIDRLVANGAEAFVGPFLTSVSVDVIDDLTRVEVPACSPSATGTVLSSHEVSVPGFFFRTAPAESYLAAAMAKTASQDGHTAVSLIYDNVVSGTYPDDIAAGASQYGVSLAASVEGNGDGSWADEVATATASGATAHLVVAAAGEAASIVSELVSAGVATSDIIGNEFLYTSAADPQGQFDGLRGVAHNLRNYPAFTERHQTFSQGGPDPFAAHTYDCFVITVLAAVSANSDDPAAIAGAMVEVTRGGTVCTTLDACLDLALAGTDLDYDGVSGRGEWSDAGEPTETSYQLFTFQSGQPVDGAVIEVP